MLARMSCCERYPALISSNPSSLSDLSAAFFLMSLDCSGRTLPDFERTPSRVPSSFPSWAWISLPSRKDTQAATLGPSSVRVPVLWARLTRLKICTTLKSRRLPLSAIHGLWTQPPQGRVRRVYPRGHKRHSRPLVWAVQRSYGRQPPSSDRTFSRVI